MDLLLKPASLGPVNLLDVLLVQRVVCSLLICHSRTFPS